MNAVAIILSKFAAKFPSKTASLLTAVNTRMRASYGSFAEMSANVAAKYNKSPGIKPLILTAIASVAGNQAVSLVVDEVMSDAGNGTLDATLSSGELEDLRQAANAIGQLVNHNAGDGKADTMWGHPTAEIKHFKTDMLAAFELIESTASMFGGVDSMAKAFDAFHALEPDHFRMYKDFKRVIR